MSQSGYNSLSRSNLLFGAGVLYRDTSTLLGVSRGPWRFESTETRRQPEFNGRHSPIRGLDYVIGRSAKLSGILLELGSAGINFGEFDAEVTLSDSSSSGLGALSYATLGAQDYATVGALGVGAVVQSQPRRGMQLIPTGSYVADLIWSGRLADGATLQQVYFPFAKIMYSLRSQDKGEAEFSVTIEAVQEPTGSPLDLTPPPYTLRRA